MWSETSSKHSFCRTLWPVCGKELVLILKVQLGTEKTSFPVAGAELSEEQIRYKAEVITESDFSPSLILGKNPVENKV